MDKEILEHINDRLENEGDESQVSGSQLDLQKQVDELTERAESLIRKHPVKAVVVGLLSGFLIAKLFNSGD